MKKIMTYGCALLLAITTLSSKAQFINNNGISITNSAHVKTNGDWTNAAGTSILNNGTIETADAFENHGTINAASTGGFVLNYAADKAFKAGATSSTLGFLMKKGAGDVLITGPIFIKDTLFLNGGILQLNSPLDTISIHGDAVVAASPTSYIDGLVARSGSGTMLFPVGRDGVYLPLTLYRLDASRATASVIPSPAGYTKGPGVDALINFPYAWSITEKIATDTAAYVQVSYPNALAPVANPIVVRGLSNQQYASMGARFIDNSATTTVRSYSRGLKGLFTIAQGFPGDFKTDSLALVSLYNSTDGPNWTNGLNWLDNNSNVDTWFGVTVTGQSITSVSLPTNGLTGSVADPLVDILSLQTLNLSGNNLEFIPDFSENNEITTLNVSANKLDFASLQPNVNVPGFNFAAQKPYGQPKDDFIAVNSPYTFSLSAGGVNTEYQWKRNGSIVPGATNEVYELSGINRTNMGDYILEAKNSSIPGLTLTSTVQRAIAYADIAGVLYADAATAATNGKVTLLKIEQAKYDTISQLTVTNTGGFAFEKIPLYDYQVVGFADTLIYAGALPTYYGNSILWEEADTIFLAETITDLDIVSVEEPGPPTGIGSISGYLDEEVDENGRLKAPKKVSGAGVSARRVQQSGRGKEEILTLVSYVFTNDEGEFNLSDLPQGVYRLNIQYPGYPMDETSFITITIGNSWQSQVGVAAHVENGKINVEKIIVTGMYETETYKAEVFPNPATHFVRLHFANVSSGRTYSLLDVSGNHLKADKANEVEVSIPVQGLSNGIYILKILENGAPVKTFKVSIE